MQYITFTAIALLLSGCVSTQMTDGDLSGPIQNDDTHNVSEIESLINQPYIDPLTDYIKKYSEDDEKSGFVERLSKERTERCIAVAERFRSRPLTQDSLEKYEAGYGYSCPQHVNAFARRVIDAQEKQDLPTPETLLSKMNVEKPSDEQNGAEQEQVAAQRINEIQVNECYLLTAINNYREAKEACLKTAKSGDIRSVVNMAKISLALDQYSDARAWAAKVASKSHDAQFILGELFMNGLGVEKDEQSAFNWYLLAGQQHTEAQYKTAINYHFGYGVKPNQQAAIKWYTKAAQNGHALAAFSLGAQLISQTDDEDAVLQGKHWLLQSARDGSKASAVLLGKIGQNSDEPGNQAEALAWLEIAEFRGATEVAELINELRKRVTSEALTNARTRIQRLLAESQAQS